MRKKILALLAGLSLAVTGALAGTVGTAAPAEAVNGCSGTLIEHLPVKKGTTVLSYLDLYYNRSTGVNCAVNVHTSATWGVAYNTAIILEVWRTNTYSKSSYVATVQDQGLYKYYAGPVSYKAAGMCVSGVANMYTASGAFAGSVVLPIGHCGK